MKNAKLPPPKKLDLGDTEALSSDPNRYDRLWNDNYQTHEQQAKALFDLGREHAREWLNDPRSELLSSIRLQFQNSVIDALEWSELNVSSVQAAAVGIVQMLAMYNAGIDKALQDFVLLAKAMPQEVMQ